MLPKTNSVISGIDFRAVIMGDGTQSTADYQRPIFYYCNRRLMSVRKGAFKFNLYTWIWNQETVMPHHSHRIAKFGVTLLCIRILNSVQHDTDVAFRILARPDQGVRILTSLYVNLLYKTLFV